MTFLSNVNWVDVLVFLIILRAFFIGIKRGIVVEIFKFIGVSLSIFCSFHLYSKFALFIKNYLPLKNISLEPFSFIFIVIVVNISIALLRNLFLLIFKCETTNIFEKIFGAALGILRGALLSSLIFSFFMLIGNVYFIKSMDRSSFGNKILSLSSQTYNFIFDKIINNFFAQEEKNNEAKIFLLNEGGV